MTTLKKMRDELLRAHQEGHVEDVRLMSDISGAPKDATEIFICYLALEAARGSYAALAACNAVREYEESKKHTV